MATVETVVKDLTGQINVAEGDAAFATISSQLSAVVGIIKETPLEKAKMDDLHKTVKHRLNVSRYVKGKTNAAKMAVEYAVMEVALRDACGKFKLCSSISELVELYPDLEGRSDPEKARLLRFRNYMALAVTFHNAEKNMKYLLDLCTDLSEGPSKRYITGSGQSQETTDRVSIYRRESGVDRLPRPPRKQDEEVAAADEGRGEEEDVMAYPDVGYQGEGVMMYANAVEAGYDAVVGQKRAREEDEEADEQLLQEPRYELFGNMLGPEYHDGDIGIGDLDALFDTLQQQDVTPLGVTPFGEDYFRVDADFVIE